jgi:E3 ubiquitin-protein ligase HUWE1
VSNRDLLTSPQFLEGFLRNTDNIKEFVNYGGPELLLSYYSLPMLPYNFSISNAFDSLSFVFRVISDVSPMPFAKLITQKVYESSRFIFEELDHGKSVVYEYISVDGNAFFFKNLITANYLTAFFFGTRC